MQDDSYKDRLLIVDNNLVGIKNRGVNTNNAEIVGNPVNFHPMLRDNWGTEDPLRGVLGSYYTKYLMALVPSRTSCRETIMGPILFSTPSFYQAIRI